MPNYIDIAKAQIHVSHTSGDFVNEVRTSKNPAIFTVIRKEDGKSSVIGHVEYINQFSAHCIYIGQNRSGYLLDDLKNSIEAGCWCIIDAPFACDVESSFKDDECTDEFYIHIDEDGDIFTLADSGRVIACNLVSA